MIESFNEISEQNLIIIYVLLKPINFEFFFNFNSTKNRLVHTARPKESSSELSSSSSSTSSTSSESDFYPTKMIRNKWNLPWMKNDNKYMDSWIADQRLCQRLHSIAHQSLDDASKFLVGTTKETTFSDGDTIGMQSSNQFVVNDVVASASTSAAASTTASLKSTSTTALLLVNATTTMTTTTTSGSQPQMLQLQSHNNANRTIKCRSWAFKGNKRNIAYQKIKYRNVCANT